MDKIKRILTQKRGVFLTLGITFLSLVILSLATLILRHAESSDERLMELAAYDRLYNLDRSVSDAFYLYDTSVANFDIRFSNSSIYLSKFSLLNGTDMLYLAISKLFLTGYLCSNYFPNSYLSCFGNLIKPASLNGFGSLGLTFQRPKTNDDIWYRYFYTGNNSNLSVVNYTWVHVFSFNENTSIDYFEAAILMNISRPVKITFQKLNLSIDDKVKHVRFKLRISNNSHTLCFPPENLSTACDKWANLTLSEIPSNGLLMQNWILENLAQGGEQFKSRLIAGDIGQNFLYGLKGEFIAIAPTNASFMTKFAINLTNPQRMKLFDIATFNPNLTDFGIGSSGPIRIA